MSPTELRRIFNDSGYPELVDRGEITLVETASSVFREARMGMPIGTVSRRVAYYDRDRNHVATVHEYRKPDGTLGASGRPDPKSVLVAGVLYLLDNH